MNALAVSAKAAGICYHFLKGTCKFEKDCRYKHEQLPKGSGSERGRSPGKGKGKGGSRGNTPPRPRKEVDCTFWMRGSCKKEKKCDFKHDPAKKGTKPKKEGSGSDSDSDSSVTSAVVLAAPVSRVPKKVSFASMHSEHRRDDKPGAEIRYFYVTTEMRPRKYQSSKTRHYSCNPQKVNRNSAKDAEVALLDAKKRQDRMIKYYPEVEFRLVDSNPASNLVSILKPSEPITAATVYVVDTGSGVHLRRRTADMATIRGNKLQLKTAAGMIYSTDRCELEPEFGGQYAEVLDDTPDVLSVGRLVASGWDFYWPRYRGPVLTAPDGRKFILKLQNFVPIIDSEVLQAVNHDSAEFSAGDLSSFAAPAEIDPVPDLEPPPGLEPEGNPPAPENVEVLESDESEDEPTDIDC